MLKAQEKFSIKCKGDDKPFQNSGVATANDQPHSWVFVTGGKSIWKVGKPGKKWQ